MDGQGATAGTFFYALLSRQLAFDFAPAGWIWAALFAIVSTVLAVTFLWWGIGLLGPARAAIIGSLEPLLSVLLSILVLGEALSPLQALGGILILSGVVLVRLNLRGGKQPSATSRTLRSG